MLAYVLIIGSPERFRCGKQIGSFLGLIPCEDSSASRQRPGHISKQGNSLLRFLLLEAAQAAVREMSSQLGSHVGQPGVAYSVK